MIRTPSHAVGAGAPGSLRTPVSADEEWCGQGAAARRRGRRCGPRRHARRSRGAARRRRRRGRLEAPPDQLALGRGRGRHQRRARQRVATTTPRATPSTRSRAPTTWATRTRSRSCAARRPATSSSSSTWARSSRASPTAASPSAPSAPRARRAPCYSADITGHVLLHVLYEQLAQARRDGLRGVLRDRPRRSTAALRRRARLGHRARAACTTVSATPPILATGGMGRMYYGTTNAYACTGDGMAMALRAGVPLKDMEFMQFHPTTLKANGVLITEGCRGEGGVPAQRRTASASWPRYAPNAMELASPRRRRRAEWTEIEEGRGVDGCVLLDLTHLGAKKINRALPGSPRARARLRGRRSASTSRSPCGPAPTTTWAASTRTSTAATLAARPVRRGRGRVRVGARREPAGRQLADGDGRVRPPRRAARRRRGGREPQRRARARSRRCATSDRAHPRDLRAAPAASARGERARGARDDDVRQRRRLPHQRAARARPRRRARAARAYGAGASSTTRATASTPT